MAECTPSRTDRTTASTRSGGTLRAASYISVVRNDSVALAPEPAAVGLCWVSVMACSSDVGAVVRPPSGAGPAIPGWVSCHRRRRGTEPSSRRARDRPLARPFATADRSPRLNARRLCTTSVRATGGDAGMWPHLHVAATAAPYCRTGSAARGPPLPRRVRPHPQGDQTGTEQMRPQRADENAGTGAAVREHLLERPVRPLPRPRRLLRDAGGVYAANGLIGLVFAATGPVAVILAVGAQGGLSQLELASWVFGAFFLNGVLTVVACWLYRQPLAFFWTIPGTVLVGPALTHLSWPQVGGAFFATGLLVLLLGLSGWVRRAMAVVPMPIVMAMVAGIFLRFGIDLVHSLRDDVGIAAPMLLTFLLLSALPGLGRWIPPIIGALIVGVGTVVLSGRVRRAGAAGARVVAAGDAGAAPAAGHHRAGGAERPGDRGAALRRARSADQR